MSSKPLISDPEPPYGARLSSGPISMINSVARQITAEAGLKCVSDLQDLVIIAYVGLLDSPPPDPVNRNDLLERSRHDLIIWAWEQGTYGDSLPVVTPSGRR
jgi:hypothetical protein